MFGWSGKVEGRERSRVIRFRRGPPSGQPGAEEHQGGYGQHDQDGDDPSGGRHRCLGTDSARVNGRTPR
ncbi:hypothetical protein AN221_17140 [Streptomyces nanshensis]|uniref:Uncharacterized protein n=1 Tax=Streptomyces nanshensis TaxID=518642 RepID=A0A1E7LTH2_9ACTN|nr:hypothetical protein AN221_17140 [Streptomyces nanshensis]